MALIFKWGRGNDENSETRPIINHCISRHIPYICNRNKLLNTMKTMHIGKAVINFFQKGIVLSLLIFVGLTARAHPPPTEGPYSKGKGSSSTDCAYALSPARAEVTAEASNGEVAVTVTTDAGCPWTTDSNDLWITITSATSGTGPGTVTYSYKANMSDQERTGTLMIGGQTYTVRQAGRPLI